MLIEVVEHSKSFPETEPQSEAEQKEIEQRLRELGVFVTGDVEMLNSERLKGGLRTKGLFDRKSQNDKPLVSIITVCLNSEKYIKQTIESVIKQTYDNIEYIIIDGGSTDRTLDIIRRYEDRIAYWVSEPDEGIYDAMNKGIDLSSGEIIGILNSDDWYEPNTVGKVVDTFLQHSEATLVHGAMVKWSINGKIAARYSSKEKLSPILFMPFNHPTCFVKKDVYLRLGKFDTSFSTASDYDFALRFLKAGEIAIYIDDVLTNFRKSGVTGQRSNFPISEIWRLLRKNGYSCLRTVEGITFRFFRDNLAKIMSLLLLNKQKGKIGSKMHYRKY